MLYALKFFEKNITLSLLGGYKEQKEKQGTNNRDEIDEIKNIFSEIVRV